MKEKQTQLDVFSSDQYVASKALHPSLHPPPPPPRVLFYVTKYDHFRDFCPTVCRLWAHCFREAPLFYFLLFFFLPVTVFKMCPDSQLCDCVNDGCRCCWSAQVTAGQKNESNRCCWQWDLNSDTETSLMWGHLEVEQMDMPVCRCLASFFPIAFSSDHGGVGVAA